MRTWSIADVIDNATIGFVRAASLGAVVVQGVFDAFTHQPDPDSHPIPGCPDAVECRTHGCAGDCSEAVEYEADAVSCPMGGACPPECDRDALACVQIYGPASEHAAALRRNQTSRAVSADSSRDSAAESCSTPRSTSAACTDPSPTGDEGSLADSDIRKSPARERTDYRPLYAEKRCGNCGYWRGVHFGDDYSDDNSLQCPASTTFTPSTK